MLSSIITAYLDIARAEGRLAKSTLQTWAPLLRQYLRWQGADARLSDFNTTNLQNYAHYLTTTGHRPRAVRSAFSALKSLGAYLVRAHILPDNPAAAVRLPKMDPAQRELCTDAEIADLFAACDRMADERRAALARGLLTCFAFAGLRRSECLDLKLGDVNLHACSLLVRHGKGDKARIAYLPRERMASLRAWLRIRGEARHDWLWSLDCARRLHDTGLQHLLEEVCAISGHKGARNLLPHSIRHNYATRLLRAGVDLVTVQRAMGHAHLGTTYQYLHTDEAALKAAAERTDLRPVEETRQASHSARRWRVQRLATG